MRHVGTRIGLLAVLALLTIPILLVRPAAEGGGGSKPIPGGPGQIVFQTRVFTSGPTLFPINVMKPDGSGVTALTTPNKGGYVSCSPVFADGTLKIGWTDLDLTTGKRCVAVANFMSGSSIGPISYIAVPVDDLPSDGSIESMDWGLLTTLPDGTQTVPICFTVGGTWNGVYETFIRVVSLSYADQVFQVGGSTDIDPGVGYNDFNGRFSPDGRWLALDRNDFLGGTAHYALWLIDLTTWAQRVLIDGPGSLDRSAAWSPDGTRLAFASDRDKGQDIYMAALNPDLSVGQITRLTSSRNNSKGWPTWSPDGAQIAYMYSSSPSSLKVGKILLGSSTEYALADGGWPAWSP
jgi:dipeptidyl aminopeptidase/acylaminoacyl peptidase